MHHRINQRALWLSLIFIAAIPRILGAFFLPNAFGDAYVYIRDIGVMSMKIAARTFSITDLYGFWLPLYQLICAVINVIVRNGFYVGKVMAAIFGIGVSLLVYIITLQLTAHRGAALAAFTLIALNPLHIFYSASAMTDVPHAFFVLASLCFCLQSRWALAAIFAALAGLTRMESWMFLALIPMIQFLKERRVSFGMLVILAIPPLFWFYISWKAAGDWLACFKARHQYHDWLLAANPSLAHFSFAHVLRDSAMLLVSTDIAVMLGCLVAGWLVLKRLAPAGQSPGPSENTSAICPPVIFFFAFLGLIVVAYLTGTQPIIFPRYGLILFSLGIPILAWSFLTIRRQHPLWARRLLISVVAICAFDASTQLVGSIGVLNQYSVQRAVADYLRDHFDIRSTARIFCDEGTVRALSGIPAERFVSSADAPRDQEAFLNFLHEKDVEYLITIPKDDSLPAKLFRSSEYDERIGNYESIMSAHAGFLLTSIHLYRRNPAPN